MWQKVKHGLLVAVGGIGSAAAVIKAAAPLLTSVLGPSAGVAASIAAGVAVASAALAADLRKLWGGAA